MGYKLSALIANQATSMTPPLIYLSAFGVQKGDSEVADHDCPDGILGKVRRLFNVLNDTKKGKPKPLTFSWFPSGDYKQLFHNLKNKKLRITVFVEQYDGKAKWTFVFDDVEIIGNPEAENKTFKDKTVRKDERINAAFMKFIDDKG